MHKIEKRIFHNDTLYIINNFDNLTKEQADAVIEKAFAEHGASCILPLSVYDIEKGVFLVVKADDDFLYIWSLTKQ